MPSKTRKALAQSKRKSISGRAPRSFGEALTKGWTIHEQLASWSFNGANKREGFLILTNGKSSSKTLMVKYTALYDLGAPYFLRTP